MNLSASKPAVPKTGALAGLLFTAVGLIAQTPSSQQSTAPGSPSILQQRYDNAQRLQAANNLPAAAQQYRIFLADALGEIAVGLAQSHNFDEAANDFDEALHLVPQFSILRLQYARAALEAGNTERAQLEAQAILASPALAKQTAAGAHEVLGRLLLKLDKDAEAKKEFDQAVALDPTFDNGYELAIADLDLGDAKSAGGIFAEMLKAYGDSAQLHMVFGQAYAGSDFQAESTAEFKAALARDPKLPGLHYSLAVAALAHGDSHLDEAQSELRQEIAISPDNAPAFAALGHLLATNSADPARSQEAEGDLKHAALLDSTNPDAFFFLGQLYADTNRPDEAIAALRKSIASTTDPSRNAFQVQKAHYLLGRLLLKAGQPEAGKAELAISEDLTHRNLRRDQSRLSEYLGSNDTAHGGTPLSASPEAAPNPAKPARNAERVKALEAQLAPAIADSYNNLGAIAASQNQFTAAVAAFGRAAEWNPRLPGLDYNWGRAAFAAGQSSEAIGPLQRYLGQHPEDDGARAVLGLCFYNQKRYKSTLDTLASLQNKTETAVQVRFVYADSLVQTGNISQGITQLEALAKQNPSVLDIHRALGNAYASTHQPKAAPEYQAALTLNPDDIQSLKGLAKLELASGDATDAIARLKHAVQLQPADQQLQQELAEASHHASRP